MRFGTLAVQSIGQTTSITTTTICGTDMHILKGEFPVEAGRTIGHEPVGVIAELGAGVNGYAVGQRVIIGRDYTLRTMPSMS